MDTNHDTTEVPEEFTADAEVPEELPEETSDALPEVAADDTSHAISAEGFDIFVQKYPGYESLYDAYAMAKMLRTILASPGAPVTEFDLSPLFASKLGRHAQYGNTLLKSKEYYIFNDVESPAQMVGADYEEALQMAIAQKGGFIIFVDNAEKWGEMVEVPFQNGYITFCRVASVHDTASGKGVVHYVLENVDGDSKNQVKVLTNALAVSNIAQCMGYHAPEYAEVARVFQDTMRNLEDLIPFFLIPSFVYTFMAGRLEAADNSLNVGGLSASATPRQKKLATEYHYSYYEWVYSRHTPAYNEWRARGTALALRRQLWQNRHPQQQPRVTKK